MLVFVFRLIIDIRRPAQAPVVDTEVGMISMGLGCSFLKSRIQGLPFLGLAAVLPAML